MIEHDLVLAALAAVRRPEDAFADLFAERTAIAVYDVAEGERSDVQLRAHQGIGLRRVGPAGTQHVHTPSLSEAGLDTLVRTLRDNHWPDAPPRGAPCPELDRADLQDLAAIAHEAEAEARRSQGDRVHVSATTRVVRQSVLIGRCDGRVTAEVRQYASIRVEATARQGRKIRTGHRAAGAGSIGDLRRGDQHLRLARQAAESAMVRLDAVDAPSGELPVILAPGGPATLLHEACGHPLEADLARHPGSAYHGLLGTRLAAPIVTLVDDPRAVDAAPVYSVDDEGEPARPTVLIERGILRDYLSDRCSSGARGRGPNGHARRLTYAYPPLPRMSTTYVAPGEHTAEEIIAQTERGILVQSIAGGDTDMGSGRFNLQVDEGYLVEGGHITAPIRGAMLSGHGPDVLRSIDRVGDDCQFLSHCYVCNKLDQFPVLVSVGQPMLRIARLTVWGG